MALCLVVLCLVALRMMVLYLVVLRFGCALLGGAALWLRYAWWCCALLGCATYDGALLGGALFWVVFLPFSTLSLPFCYSLLSLLCVGIKNNTRTRKGVRECLGGEAAVNIKRHARHHQ